MQGRRDEMPNQELARELAQKKNQKGIQEIVDALDNKKLQNDCIKVLYEIGAIDPTLIADYATQFVRLLSSRNNRLVWGGMTALATIAEIRAKDIVANLAAILKAFDSGSVIAVDNGVRVLARAASAKEEYNRKIFPILLDHLKKCRPKEVPQHSESTLPAVTSANKKKFIAVLNARLDILTPSQATRVRKVIKAAESK
jgi:hypothetical protein